MKVLTCSFSILLILLKDWC